MSIVKIQQEARSGAGPFPVRLVLTKDAAKRLGRDAENSLSAFCSFPSPSLRGWFGR